MSEEDVYLVTILSVACKKSIGISRTPPPHTHTHTHTLGEWIEIVKEIYNMELTFILKLKVLEEINLIL